VGIERDRNTPVIRKIAKLANVVKENDKDRAERDYILTTLEKMEEYDCFFDFDPTEKDIDLIS